MPRRQSKARSLSIFLLKQGFPSPEESLADPIALTRISVEVDSLHTGILYVKPTTDRMPNWWSLFAGAANVAPADLHNASSAAVFLINSGDRLFALTFGYGRSLLRPGS